MKHRNVVCYTSGMHFWKHTTLVAISSLLLAGCSTAGSLLSGTGTGSTFSFSGSIAFFKNTYQNIADAGTITIQSIQAIRTSVDTRIRRIQEGTKKIQKGKDMIQDGLL